MAARKARGVAPQLLFDDGTDDAAPATRSLDDLLEQYAPKKEPGALEAFARGGAQGFTADFADEIAGRMDQAFGADYKTSRDASREKFRAAEQSNPLAYGAGKVVGGLASILLPGGNVVKGVGLGANLARGAFYGAAQGVGESEKEGAEALEDAPRAAALGAAAGGAGHVALTGLAKVLSPIAKRVGDRAAREADEYAASRLQDAQREGGEAVQREAEKFAPLLEKEPAARAAAAASPEAAGEAAAKQLTERAWDRLRIENPNALKKKIVGPRGAREEEIKEVLRGDAELRAAIDASTDPGVGVGARAFRPGEGPDAALEIVGQRLKVEGERLDRVYATAQDATPGGKAAAVLSGLRELRDEYAKLGATKPLAKIVAAEMKRIQEDYIARKAKNIPLQRMREEYRGWQDKGFSGAGELSESAQKELQRDMANVWRAALHEEVERVASRNPSKMGDLMAELKSANKRTSALKGIEALLDEWSIRSHAAAPTMGEMTLSPLKAIRNAVEQSAAQAGRAVVGRAAAAAARRPPAGTPTAAVARLMQAAREGTLTTAMLQKAAAEGVPPEVIADVQRFGGIQ